MFSFIISKLPTIPHTYSFVNCYTKESFVISNNNDSIAQQIVLRFQQSIISPSSKNGSTNANSLINDPSLINTVTDTFDVYSLTGHDWFRVLNTHPHLANNHFCDLLGKVHWKWLLKTQPQLINYLNPYRFSKDDIMSILNDVPLFI